MKVEPRRAFRLAALLPALLMALACRDAGAPAQGGEPVASPPAASPLKERAAELGLRFEHWNGAQGKLYFSEMMAPGVGLFDADGDGDLDVLALQGAPLGNVPPEKALRPPSAEQMPLRARLFRNLLVEEGRLRFTDVTAASGILAEGYGYGLATGDIDGDGDTDLYLLADGGNQLWRNDGKGHFDDVTQEAGVALQSWSASAIFFDAEGDGDLDLYVANYVDFTVENAKPCRALTGAADYCGPLTHNPLADRFFRNEGRGHFVDATLEAGLAARKPGAGLGVIDGDWNGDGFADLYVANDGMPNVLWQNRGDGTFEDKALEAGVSLNAAGQAEASMGIAAADVDNDLDEDLLLTHLTQETNTFYRNLGHGSFEDASVPSGLGAPSLELTGFGAVFLDLDNDGWLDLLTVNGKVKSAPALAQRKQLFRNRQGRFAEILGDAYLAQEKVGRGLAAGDLDNDGDSDAVVANNAGPLELLLNENPPPAKWIGLRLVGPSGSDALGAQVLLEAGGRKFFRRVRSGGSYGSAGDPRLLFGLGDVQEAAAIEVTWPDGKKERFEDLVIGRYHTLRQGEGHA